jgi:hypothetical protein
LTSVHQLGGAPMYPFPASSAVATYPNAYGGQQQPQDISPRHHFQQQDQQHQQHQQQQQQHMQQQQQLLQQQKSHSNPLSQGSQVQGLPGQLTGPGSLPMCKSPHRILHFLLAPLPVHYSRECIFLSD